jgi:hypothetical protein
MSPAASVQQAQSLLTTVVHSVSTGAGAFLSGAVDLLDYEGLVEVIQDFGALTGSTTVPVLTQSDTSGGTYVALDTGATAFGVAANAVTSVKFSASESKRFIKYGCTITTGPILMSVTVVGFKKYR